MLTRTIKRLTDGQLGKDSLTAIFTQFSNAFFSLITAVIFARMLGVSEFGAYTVVFAWATLFGVLGRIGLDAYIIRELSIALEQKNWSHSLGILISALVLVLLLSSVLAIAIYMAFLWLDPDIDPLLKRLFGYSCLLIPTLSLEIILHSVLTSAGHNSTAAWIRFFIRPLLLIAVLLAAYTLDYSFTGLDAILSQMWTMLIASGLLIVTIVVVLPRELLISPPKLNLRVHSKGGLRFLAIAGLGIMISNTDLVMLGFISTAEEAGMYRVASRVAAVIALTMLAVSLPLGSRLAVLYKTGKHEQLKQSYYRANVLSFILALPLFIIFLTFRTELLSIFGTEFQAASVLLIALSVIAIFEVFIGPSALCLTMIGKEKIVTVVLAVAAIANIMLNLALIPKHGAMGAVAASAITVFGWKLTVWFLLYKELGILPGGLGLLIRKTSQQTARK